MGAEKNGLHYPYENQMAATMEDRQREEARLATIRALEERPELAATVVPRPCYDDGVHATMEQLREMNTSLLKALDHDELIKEIHELRAQLVSVIQIAQVLRKELSLSRPTDHVPNPVPPAISPTDNLMALLRKHLLKVDVRQMAEIADCGTYIVEAWEEDRATPLLAQLSRIRVAIIDRRLPWCDDWLWDTASLRTFLAHPGFLAPGFVAAVDYP